MHARADDARELMTIAEIAKRFDLPESTARFYCKRFMDYMPHVGAGKRRRYRPEVLDVFRLIISEMQKHKNAAAVESALARKFPRNIEVGPAGGVSGDNGHDRVFRAYAPGGAPGAGQASEAEAARDYEYATGEYSTGEYEAGEQSIGRFGDQPARLPGAELAGFMGFLQRQGEVLDQVAQALNKLAAREDEVCDLRAKLAASEQEIERLRSRVADVREYQEEAERMHQNDLEQLRKWLSHLAQVQSELKDGG